MLLTEPVERCSQRGLLRASPERESFANDYPNERTPGGGETCDEHASSNDHDDTGSGVVLRWERNTDDGKDEQPSSLPETANDERHTATDSLNEVQPGDRHGHVDSTKNKLNLERIINACGLEDSRAIL